MIESVLGKSVAANLSTGGTVDGDLTITGDLGVAGDVSINLTSVVSNSTIIDATGTEALLVRKDSDGGDVFVVDTTNSKVSITDTLNVNPTISSGSKTSLAFQRSGTNKWRFIQPHDDSYLKLYNDSASATQMYFKSDNKIGIANNTPLATLDIVGDRTINLTNTTSDDTNKNAVITHSQYDSGTETEGFVLMQGFSNSSTNRIDIGGGNSQHNATEEIKFHTASNSTTATGTERMVINNAGSVGIGSSIPISNVEIKGTNR